MVSQLFGAVNEIIVTGYRKVSLSNVTTNKYV